MHQKKTYFSKLGHTFQNFLQMFVISYFSQKLFPHKFIIFDLWNVGEKWKRQIINLAILFYKHNTDSRNFELNNWKYDYYKTYYKKSLSLFKIFKYINIKTQETSILSVYTFIVLFVI